MAWVAFDRGKKAVASVGAEAKQMESRSER
jgi:hypothetical protein